MNAVSETDQPPEGTVSSNNASRRTFLKGVGIAGAAGLAAPLLARTSARAATTGIVLGANADCWNFSDTTHNWQSLVPNALGCRSYRPCPFTTAQGCPTTFPGVDGTKPLASIRPDPDTFLNTQNLDQAIKNLILDGMIRANSGYAGPPPHFAGTPQLNVWHEAGNLYTNKSGAADCGGTWGNYDLTPQTVRSMHVKMQELCNEQAAAFPGLPRVEYGCIIYGVISQMASDTDPTHNWVPGVAPDLSKYPLDWYGIDVYYEGDPPNTGSTTPHPDLATYDLVSDYMGGFLTMARNRTGLTWPKINVCECNANATDDGARPQFFENLALWLYNNGGRRMLTFFPNPAGPHSVTWEHVADVVPPAIPYTINALNYIQSHYG